MICNCSYAFLIEKAPPCLIYYVTCKDTENILSLSVIRSLQWVITLPLKFNKQTL